MKSNNTAIVKIATGLAGAALLVSGFALTASAANGASVGVGAKGQASLSTVIARGDKEIQARIDSLNQLNARVSGLKNVSAGEKANIASEVSTETASLTTLKAKIDADTDVTVARTDVKTITADYRIYALVMPQMHIAAAADRVGTIGAMMTALQPKLQTRITAAQTAGHDVTALNAAYADITAKVADANTQATNANSAVASLVPDQGNATVAASNKAAVEAARADLKNATNDLKAARADIKTITEGLKAFK